MGSGRGLGTLPATMRCRYSREHRSLRATSVIVRSRRARLSVGNGSTQINVKISFKQFASVQAHANECKPLRVSLR